MKKSIRKKNKRNSLKRKNRKSLKNKKSLKNRKSLRRIKRKSLRKNNKKLKNIGGAGDKIRDKLDLFLKRDCKISDNELENAIKLIVELIDNDGFLQSQELQDLCTNMKIVNHSTQLSENGFLIELNEEIKNSIKNQICKKNKGFNVTVKKLNHNLNYDDDEYYINRESTNLDYEKNNDKFKTIYPDIHLHFYPKNEEKILGIGNNLHFKLTSRCNDSKSSVYIEQQINRKARECGINIDNMNIDDSCYYAINNTKNIKSSFISQIGQENSDLVTTKGIKFSDYFKNIKKKYDLNDLNLLHIIEHILNELYKFLIFATIFCCRLCYNNNDLISDYDCNKFSYFSIDNNMKRIEEEKQEKKRIEEEKKNSVRSINTFEETVSDFDNENDNENDKDKDKDKDTDDKDKINENSDNELLKKLNIDTINAKFDELLKNFLKNEELDRGKLNETDESNKIILEQNITTIKQQIDDTIIDILIESFDYIQLTQKFSDEEIKDYIILISKDLDELNSIKTKYLKKIKKSLKKIVNQKEKDKYFKLKKYRNFLFFLMHINLNICLTENEYFRYKLWEKYLECKEGINKDISNDDKLKYITELKYLKLIYKINKFNMDKIKELKYIFDNDKNNDLLDLDNEEIQKITDSVKKNKNIKLDSNKIVVTPSIPEHIDD